jgi:SHS2 domain-containing protein
MASMSTPTEQRYSYFDHEADMGIVGYGSRPEAAMESAAEATFALMADLGQIRPVRSVQVAFDETDPELALVVWLNRLLAEARAEGLALGHFTLEHTGSHWRGAGWGEPWHSDLERGVEVKGATLTMLAVRHTADGWEARCVVDV